MAKGDNITTKFTVDISDLKKGIADANQQMKLANAEFKKATAGMDDWTKSAEGIKAKLSQLESVLAAQKTKVAAYKEELERTEKAYEVNSKKAEELQKQLDDLSSKGVKQSDEEFQKLQKQLESVQKEADKNAKSADDLKVTILNQEAAVASTEKEMGKYEAALKDADGAENDTAKSAKNASKGLDDVGDSSEKAEKKVDGLASKLAGGIAAGLAALGTAAAGAVASLAKMSSETATYADEMNTLSTVTGISTDDLQAYAYAADLVDVSLDTITGTMTKTIKSIKSAQSGTGASAEAFAALGVAVTDSEGNLRDVEDVYWDAIDALGKMEEGTERDALAMDIFGKSAQDLNPLIKQGSKGMKALAKEAEDAGVIMSSDALDSAQDFKDSLDKLKGGAAAAKNALGTVLMPQLQSLAGEGSSLLARFTNGILQANGDWSMISKTIADTVTGIATFIVGELPKFMQLGIDIVTSLLSALVTAFPSLIQGLTELFPTLLEGAVQLLMAMVDALPFIVAALAEALPDIITVIVETLIENLPVLLEGAIQLFMALVQAIPEICSRLAEKLPEIIDTFIETLQGPLLDVFSDLWDNIVEVWNVVSGWFDEHVIQPVVNFFRDLREKVSGFFKSLWEGIKGIWNAVSGWFNANVITPVRNFFSGLWNGISTAALNAWAGIKNAFSAVSSWFNNKVVAPVKNFFSGMWNGLKTGAKNAWEGIKKPFTTVATWFKEKFQKAWEGVKNVFSTGGQIFQNIKDGISSVFVKVVNSIIRGINTVVAAPFNTINWVLRTLRDLTILGVSPFGWISLLNVPQIPEISTLAQGGVLKRGQMAFLEGSGAEAVVPLEKNKEWIRNVAADMLTELKQGAGITNSSITEGNTVQNFTQVINAPKAPSRIELYRQTRNLLAYAKGVG